MASLGLALIVRDEVEDVERILREYDRYFDAVFITVTGPNMLSEFQKIQSDKVEWSEFHWVDNFAKARNANLRQVATDYFVWMDADDALEHPEKLRQIVARMEAEKIDAVFLPYNYMQNEDGECIAWQERERVIKTSHPWKWKGAIHESLVSSAKPTIVRDDSVVFHHRRNFNDITSSSERNHKILTREYNKQPRDPRITHYLGLSYFMRREYDKAVETLLEHIQESGWDEEKYRSWCKIAEAHIILDDYAKAQAACNAAVDLLPSYPEAYFIKAEISFLQDNYKGCIEWLKVAVQKEQPATASVVDPSRKIRAFVIGAISYTNLGDPKEAYLTLQDALAISPNNSEAKNLKEIMQYNYVEDKILQMIESLAAFYEAHHGEVPKLLESLPPEMFSDPRLNALRAKYIPPVIWPEGSVVFFCGGAANPWGADTLAEGMGGSEEAIVYLSRELARLGREVYVYNERETEYIDYLGHATDFDGELQEKDVQVTYRPWNTINPNDEFDTVVIWRAPENARMFQANKILCDMHDVIEAPRVYAEAENITQYLVKSQYHRDLYPELPDDKVTIIGNGLVKEQL
jgi:tetratricopeptide (TPR) repeat protein